MVNIRDNNHKDSIRNDLYRIGTTAKLTGISVERLRAWERRYGIEPAHRSGKTRFYSADQLEWLHKIKLLVESGHPISTLAGLSTDNLEERLLAQKETKSGDVRVGLIGTNLLLLQSQNDSSNELTVVHTWPNFQKFQNQKERKSIDVLVAQLPSIDAQSIESVRQLAPGCRIICIYQFANDKQLNLLKEMDIPSLRWPLSWSELESACINTNNFPKAATKSLPRRYSDEQLLELAAHPFTNDTNYLKFLVELITSLNAFADYSEGFLLDQHANSELFKRVHADTTKARAQLELAITTITKFEQKTSGIDPKVLD